MIKRLLPLAAALVMAGPAAHAQTTKLALGMSGWTGFAPLTLADKAGLFKKHGLDVELKMIPQKDRKPVPSPHTIAQERGGEAIGVAPELAVGSNFVWSNASPFES